ncbi:MAG: hypothetical protein V4813_06730 [Gemmatimonadota bacterium]
MTVLRPLPPTPSLEFARKEAKALLRQLRANDVQAVHRLQAAQGIAPSSIPDSYQLAEAQLTLAREYGFTGWPRLVRYFATAERQRHRQHSSFATPSAYEHWARSLLADHAKRRVRAGKMLAEFTPRFFGVPLDHVFRATITEDEARHALARDIGCASWSALIAQATEAMTVRDDGWDEDVEQLAISALHRADLTDLQEITRQHPALLRPSERETERNSGIVNFALGAESQRGMKTMRPIMTWLESQGFDVDARRSAQLCGSMFTKVADVQSLLDRGADPNWVAPNGLSVLEHALLRYGNGACVDLIARRVTPPRALWIAAGLGDVETVATFLDAAGKPTAAARAHRPDFTAVGPFSWPSRFDADDETILFETAYVAASNGRVPVLAYLLSRALPVNSLAWDYPLLTWAVSRGWLPIVECLMRHGADPDLASRSAGIPAARELGHQNLSRRPWDEEVRAIAILIGIDAAAVLAERNRRVPPTLGSSPELQRILQLANDDALRQGAAEVAMEHVLFGMLRSGGMVQYMLSRGPVMDYNRFRRAVLPRVRVGDPAADQAHMPRAHDVSRAVDDAVALAATRHDEAAHGIHLLAVLAAMETALQAFLSPYGGSLARLREVLASSLQYDNAT